MTQRRNKHRPPLPSSAERSGREAAGLVDRFVSGLATHVRVSSALVAICGLLLLAVVVVFGQTLLYGFVNFDDDVFVYENPIVARGITAQGVVSAFSDSGGAMPYPLTLISYMLDRQVFGLAPWGFHLTNVLLHAATTVMLLLLLRRITGNLWASAFVTLLFAIHPLRAETVAWVSDRKGVLSGFFFVATIAAYVAYARRPFSLARYLAVAGLFILTLLAKPQLVTLPGVLLLLDYWPLGRWRPAVSGDQHVGTSDAKSLSANDSPLPYPGEGQGVRATRTISRSYPSVDPKAGRESLLRLVVEKIPLFLISIAGCVAAVLSQAGNIAPLEELSIPARIGNSLVSYVVYLGQFFWPLGLAAFYPRSEDPPAWQAAGALLILAALTAAALWLRRRQPAELVGWLWYLGTLVPMIGLVQIGNHVRADRYTYLPQIGLGIALVWAVSWAVKRLGSDGRLRCWLYGTGGTLLAAGLMVCAWRQTSYWQDSECLWTHALDCTSNNCLAHVDLGLALASRGQIDAAIDHYQRALEIKPDNIQAHNDLGLALASRGQFDAAIDHYRRALEIKPDYMQAHSDLGIALAGRGDVDAAIDQFQRALEISPGQADAHFNLGLALASRGDVDGAIEQYQQALESKPDYAEAHNNLGLALAGRGRVDEAIDHFRKAVEIKPDYMLAHNNLGGALAGRGQFDEAIDQLRVALEIKPDYVNAHVILGDVLAERGRLDEAREHYRTALGLASARNDKRLADLLRARLKLRSSEAAP